MGKRQGLEREPEGRGDGGVGGAADVQRAQRHAAGKQRAEKRQLLLRPPHAVEHKALQRRAPLEERRQQLRRHAGAAEALRAPRCVQHVHCGRGARGLGEVLDVARRLAFAAESCEGDLPPQQAAGEPDGRAADAGERPRDVEDVAEVVAEVRDDTGPELCGQLRRRATAAGAGRVSSDLLPLRELLPQSGDLGVGDTKLGAKLAVLLAEGAVVVTKSASVCHSCQDELRRGLVRHILSA